MPQNSTVCSEAAGSIAPRRRKILLILPAAAAVILSVRLIWLAGDRTAPPEPAADRHEAVLPTRRGAICDAAGRVLVRSRTVYDLYSGLPANGKFSITERKLLTEIFAGIPELPRLELTPEEVKQLLPARRRGLRVEIRAREVRETLVPEFRDLVPEWERRYDAELRGKPGRVLVREDRRGRWLEAKVLAEPVPGRDVRLPASGTEPAEKGR